MTLDQVMDLHQLALSAITERTHILNTTKD
jgi:hypothetical protein